MQLQNFPPLLSYVQERVPFWLLIATAVVGAFLVWLFHWPASNIKLHPMRASTFLPDRVPKKIDTIVIGMCVPPFSLMRFVQTHIL